MPWYHDREFFVSVVSLLVAGDVQARTVNVGSFFGVQVTLDDGTKLVWANNGKVWAFTRILLDGDQETFQSSLRWDAPPDEVALLVATHPYGPEPDGG